MSSKFNQDLIVTVIAEHAGIPESSVTPDVSFESLGLDSLDVVEIVMAIEDEFHIEISDEDGEKLKTVGDLYQLIKTLGQS